MKKTTLAFVLFAFLMSFAAHSQLVVNEVVSSNSTLNTDEDGEYQDWVELYNNGPAAVNLDGYGLSDNPAAPFKWVFPAVTVNPGEYVLVFCSDKDRAIAGQPLHTNWKISSGGEAITLTQPDATTADQAPAAAFPANQSWGRIPNGTGIFTVLEIPTPGSGNLLPATGLVVNEVVSSNSSLNTDEDGEYQDWVELYNNGPAAVNLNGYGLSDNPAAPFKWVFPAVTVNPGEYVLVFCSDKDRAIAGQPLHTNWKISSGGEAITLTQPDATTADQAPAMAFPQDQSWGRIPNGTGPFVIMTTPTPGAENQVGTPGGDTLQAPIFSHDSGFYTTGFTLTLSTNEPGATIIYTLDGSEPSAQNIGGKTYNYKNQYPQNPGDPIGPMLFNSFETLEYSAPVSIVDRTAQPNKISNISSTYDANIPNYFPSSNLYKTNVVRAKVVKPGFTDSPIITKNYFVTPEGSGLYNIPVVSISIDEDKLFDYEDGIYVAGKLFDDYRAANPSLNIDWPVGNYTQKGSGFERVANFNYFVGGQEVINQRVGIRVQGNYSRLYPLKSFNFYSRADLGAGTLPYKFFNDVDDNFLYRFCLKNNGSDMGNTVFRDPLVNMLTRSMNTQTEAYQPVVAFINGEFWGMMAIREKYDDKFFNRTHGIPENEIQLLENDGYQIEEGNSNAHYLAMFDFVENNPMSVQANYDYIKTQMDPDSFVDYFIQNIFLNNRDWPGNNIVFWRRDVPYNPNAPYGNDGRWRWAVHDVTSTFSQPAFNTLDLATQAGNTDWPNPDWSTVLLRKLLENDEFRYLFITRFADIMNSHYHTDRIIAVINQMKAVLAPDITDHIHRWKRPSNVSDWNWHINQEVLYAQQRPAHQRTHLRDKFGIASNIDVTVDVSNAQHGHVKVNTIDITQATPGIPASPYPWTGVYFSDIPVKLKAIAQPGYQFSHWSGASTATTEEIEISSSAAFQVTAHFVPSGFIETEQPIYFWQMGTFIPNDTPLTFLNSSFEIPAEGVINFQSSLEGYPFTNGHPDWRTASMERRNSPTPLNYRPEANGGAAYAAGSMRGLQVTQPFQNNGRENTMVFALPTSNFKNIKLSFAVKDEGAATGITVDYAINAGEPLWITADMPQSAFPITNDYQVVVADFSSIVAVDNNPNFKVRLRFTGPDMTASNGNRVTFNNIAVDGVRLPLTYPTPLVFTAGQEISAVSPTVTGGSISSYTISPALPDGLSIDPVTGVISGTPTLASSAVIYTVTGSGTDTATFDLQITVNDIAPAGLSYNTPNVFTVDSVIADLTPTVSGNINSFSISPNLPDGLSFDTATGIISGTPTVVSPTAVYTVTATNSGGSVSFDIEITVNDIAPAGLSYSTPNVFTVGSVIADLTPTVSGDNLTFSISPNLPDELSFDTATGIISGTPTMVSATAVYTVTATNSGGSVSFDIEITVNDIAPAGLSYSTPNVFTVGSVIADLTPTVSGNIISFSISPNLPDGLLFDTATGIISGTPTVVSPTAVYTVTATNSGGSVSFDVEITVNDIAPAGLSYSTPNVFTVDSVIADLTPTVSGNIISFSISPNLPDGLSFDTATGVISGTPTVVSATAVYTVTATNSGGSVSFDLEITVNDIAPAGLSYNTPNVFTVGSVIADLTPTGSGDNLTFSISPNLPDGLSFDTATGIISGTPTMVSATAFYTVTATNSGGSVSFDIEITVNDIAPAGLSYSTPNVFTVGSVIADLTPTVSGNIISFSISPNLPDGLSFDTATGIISGTPTVVSATAVYTVTATNSGGSVSFDIEITVNDIAPTSLSYVSPNIFTVDSVIADLIPTVSGNIISFSISPNLPDGLLFDTATGIISGTPTVVSATAVYTVTATNSGGSVSFDIEITVNDIAPAGLSYNTPNVFTVGSVIADLTPTVSGDNLTFSISPNLPDGLSFDTATGVISGTPTVVSPTAVYTVTATNSGGSVSFDIEITVNDIAPSGLSYNTPNVFTVGSVIADLTPTVSGDNLTFSISPNLPDGLSFDTATGVISGTPTVVSATAVYTVTATNSGGSVSFDIEITVNDIAPSGLSYSTPNVFTVDSVIADLTPTVSGDNLTFSISPNLPDGLSFDTATGVISGTPTVVSATAVYTVTATNSGGSVSFDVEITVNDIAPSGLSYNTPNVFTVGSVIADLTPNVSGNIISFSISPNLPDGLSFDTATGVISGTPTVVSATAVYTVTATNSGGSVSFDIEITVNDIAPSGLSYSTPNVFTVGSVIADLTPNVSGDNLTFSISPNLPDGLSFDTATGIISGTPTVVSPTAVYTVTATNSGGSVSFDIEITVNDIAPSGLSYSTPNVFTVGSVIAELTPTVSGDNLTFSISPNLPDGLSFDTATGVISGTPTVISATAVYTVTATNSGGSVSFDIEITVNDIAPAGLSYNTPNVFTVGSVIADLTPTVSGNVISFSISPNLPDGLSFDTATGIISGTPTVVSATAVYTVTATNSGGSVSFDIEITVNDIAPTSLSYVSPNIFTVGTAITTLQPITVGNITAYSVVPPLPNGIVLDTLTGEISGTPTQAAGTAFYTITGTNSGGSVSFNILILVNDIAPSGLSYSTPNVFTVGSVIADLTPTGSGDNLTFSISPNLPDGLSFDTATGIISGTPTMVSATAFYTVTATNSGGSVSFDIEITVNDIAPAGLSYSTPNVFTVDSVIADLTPTVSGDIISFSISPNLPDGLSFDTATGIISGTPTVVSPTAVYTVTATNSGGSVSFDLEITVNDIAPAGLSYSTPNVFYVNSGIEPLTPAVDGENLLFSVWPSLPDGLSIDPATGVITGTPTTPTTLTAYTVTVSNSGGSITFDVVITVEAELGVVTPNQESLVVYPNPFREVIYIAGWTGGKFTLFAADGRLVRQGVFASQITVDELPAGMYFLKLEVDGQTAIRKLIKN